MNEREDALRWTWPRGVAPAVKPAARPADAGREVVVDSPTAPSAQPYDPFTVINLPNAVARVKDRRSALRFIRRYGLLGHTNLGIEDWKRNWYKMEERLRDPRFVANIAWEDPLVWLLAQARTVRFAIELVGALQGEPAERLDDLLRQTELRVTMQRESIQPRQDWKATYVVARRLGNEAATYRAESAPDLARSILVDLVTANTLGVRDELSVGADTPTGLAYRRSAAALVEVVWWLVGRWAETGGIRRCALETCRTPFLVTDERQLYCPSDYVYTDKAGRQRPGRSACAALDQKRRQRQKGV